MAVPRNCSQSWKGAVLLSYLNMTQILTIPPFCWLNQLPICLTFKPPVFGGWNLHFHRVSKCFNTHRWDNQTGLQSPAWIFEVCGCVHAGRHRVLLDVSVSRLTMACRWTAVNHGMPSTAQRIFSVFHDFSLCVYSIRKSILFLYVFVVWFLFVMFRCVGSFVWCFFSRLLTCHCMSAQSHICRGWINYKKYVWWLFALFGIM